MALPSQSNPPFASEIDLPLFANDNTYVFEPPMEDGIRKSWYHSSLITYTLAGSVHAFMGPLPRFVKKRLTVKKIFPTYPNYEPLVFVNKLFKFNFFKNIVFRSSPPIVDTKYIKWFDMVEEKKTHFWRDLGIFDLI